MKRMYNLPPPNHLNYPLNNHQQQNQSPHPPDDLEQKNIIDKLANFVSRNGQEFENITKEKQKDNPKFSFLFGGTHFGYYQYRLNVERELGKTDLESFLLIYNIFTLIFETNTKQNNLKLQISSRCCQFTILLCRHPFLQ